MDRKIEKKFWNKNRIIMVSGGSVLIVFFIYSFLFADNRSKLNVEVERITIAEVQKGSFQEFIPIDGTVQPIKTIFLDVLEGGVVEKKFMEGGNLVKEGEPLIKLANNNLVLNFMTRETEMYDLINNLQNTRRNLEQNKFTLQTRLTELKYQIDAAKVLYETNQVLFDQKAISKNEYLNSKREYERLLDARTIAIETQRFDSINAISQIIQLEATINRTNRNLEMFKENLNNLLVKAPISGQLSSLNVEIGESINAGQRIGQIDDLNGFKIRARIDEHYISRIFTGLKGEFDFSRKTYNLSISKLYPEVQNGQFQVDMIFEGEVPEGIRRGQTLQIRLQLSDPAEAVMVSRGGFFQTTGGNSIFKVDESGDFAEMVDIRIGRQNPKFYEVLEGLQPGDKVIVSSYEGFGDAEKLVLREEK